MCSRIQKRTFSSIQNWVPCCTIGAQAPYTFSNFFVPLFPITISSSQFPRIVVGLDLIQLTQSRFILSRSLCFLVERSVASLTTNQQWFILCFWIRCNEKCFKTFNSKLLRILWVIFLAPFTSVTILQKETWRKKTQPWLKF